jgi:membrane protease YdiL (CAAX protease family)
MTRTEVSTVNPKPRQPLVRDDLAYFLPMAIFLAFTWVGGNWESLYPATYVAKAVVVAIALWVLWRQYTPIRWNHWWLGVIVGIIGIIQWVGMQLWLQNGWPSVIESVTILPQGLREWMGDHFKPSPDVFDPTKTFSSAVALYSFYAVRIAGAVLVVPVMEELFWRDFLWRTILAPNDFKLAKVGEWGWSAFLVVCAAFALVHGNWWLTSIVWAMMVGLLLVYTKSLGACIIAHGVTNLLLAGYVLWTKDWSFW